MRHVRPCVPVMPRPRARAHRLCCAADRCGLVRCGRRCGGARGAVVRALWTRHCVAVCCLAHCTSTRTRCRVRAAAGTSDVVWCAVACASLCRCALALSGHACALHTAPMKQHCSGGIGARCGNTAPHCGGAAKWVWLCRRSPRLWAGSSTLCCGTCDCAACCAAARVCDRSLLYWCVVLQSCVVGSAAVYL